MTKANNLMTEARKRMYVLMNLIAIGPGNGSSPVQCQIISLNQHNIDSWTPLKHMSVACELKSQHVCHDQVHCRFRVYGIINALFEEDSFTS